MSNTATSSWKTCPHYLTLNSSVNIGSRGKVNPPLRTQGDQDALWNALSGGLIDVVGSDHVPRHFSAKDKDLWSVPGGKPPITPRHRHFMGMTAVFTAPPQFAAAAAPAADPSPRAPRQARVPPLAR